MADRVRRWPVRGAAYGAAGTDTTSCPRASNAYYSITTMCTVTAVTTPIGTTSNAVNRPVGSYALPITSAGQNAPTYAITYVLGTLTVTPENARGYPPLCCLLNDPGVTGSFT